MDILQLDELKDWGARVARVAALVALTNDTLQRHRHMGDTRSMIEQYERLLAKHQQELNNLLKTHGLALQVLPPDHAA